MAAQRGSRRSKSLPRGAWWEDKRWCIQGTGISGCEEKLSLWEQFALEQVWRVCTAFVFSALIKMDVAQTFKSLKCCLYLQALLPLPCCHFRDGVGPAATSSPVTFMNGILSQPFVFRLKYYWTQTEGKKHLNLWKITALCVHLDNLKVVCRFCWDFRQIFIFQSPLIFEAKYLFLLQSFFSCEWMGVFKLAFVFLSSQVQTFFKSRCLRAHLKINCQNEWFLQIE